MTQNSDSNPTPQRIVVTGSDGLLGWHVRVFLSTHEHVEVVPCNRQTFNDDGALAECLNGADAVIHLAGMNRGAEAEFAAANVAIVNTESQRNKRAKFWVNGLLNQEPNSVTSCCLIYTASTGNRSTILPAQRLLIRSRKVNSRR